MFSRHEPCPHSARVLACTRNPPGESPAPLHRQRTNMSQQLRVRWSYGRVLPHPEDDNTVNDGGYTRARAHTRGCDILLSMFLSSLSLCRPNTFRFLFVSLSFNYFNSSHSFFLLITLSTHSLGPPLSGFFFPMICLRLSLTYPSPPSLPTFFGPPQSKCHTCVSLCATTSDLFSKHPVSEPSVAFTTHTPTHSSTRAELLYLNPQSHQLGTFFMETVKVKLW